MRPLLTVALCTHNHADRLRRTLSDLSRLRHPEHPWEFLVIDNGSTDGSQRIATEAGARVVNVETKGYGSALMHGIAEARDLLADAGLPLGAAHALQHRIGGVLHQAAATGAGQASNRRLPQMGLIRGAQRQPRPTAHVANTAHSVMCKPEMDTRCATPVARNTSQSALSSPD